jgi:5-carboxymethyl-2-hydroxymuconate isomerase
MPHIILEYSESLGRKIDIVFFLKDLHKELSEQDGFDLESIKSRAFPSKVYNISTFGEEKEFIHIQILG